MCSIYISLARVKNRIIKYADDEYIKKKKKVSIFLNDLILHCFEDNLEMI